MNSRARCLACCGSRGLMTMLLSSGSPGTIYIQSRWLLHRLSTHSAADYFTSFILIITATYTHLCPCEKTQTTFHIVESCPLTKLNGGLSRLHSADEFLADQSWFMTRIQQEADYNYVSLRDKVMCLTGGVSNMKPCLYVSNVTKLDNGQAIPC